jgi:hypothetical protein
MSGYERTFMSCMYILTMAKLRFRIFDWANSNYFCFFEQNIWREFCSGFMQWFVLSYRGNYWCAVCLTRSPENLPIYISILKNFPPHCHAFE